MRFGALDEVLELFERARGGLALALGREQRFGLQHGDHPARHHHRQGANRGGEAGDAVRQPIAGRQIAGVDPLDVEGAQPLIHQLAKFRREPRLLDFVLAEDQIDGLRRAGLNLLADGRGCEGWHQRVRGATCEVRSERPSEWR